MALGGDGDDRISVSGANAVAYGGDGEDTIWAYRENAVAWGGDGDDVLNLQNGSSGHGGAGNDLINLDTGSHGDGGDGDDMLRYVRPFYDSSDATVMHGGAGADVFDVVLNNATGGGTAQVVRITDFDPDEDVLQVGIGATPGVRLAGVRIETADDDSHTDVLVDFLGGYGGPGVTTAIIRLDGNVPITADQVVIGP